MDAAHAELVLDWYSEVESRFSSILNTIPYTPETQGTFLPSISSVVLEACSLLDTIFRNEAGAIAGQKRLTMSQFSKHYESEYHFSNRMSVFFRNRPRYICPFSYWALIGVNSRLIWWDSYNALKHDRIGNYERATLRMALLSVCALHQVIATLPCFARCLMRRNLIICSDWDPQHVLDVIHSESVDLGFMPL